MNRDAMPKALDIAPVVLEKMLPVLFTCSILLFAILNALLRDGSTLPPNNIFVCMFLARVITCLLLIDFD
jgi:hypothetical protein